jgi:hypothetical protein
LPKVGPLHMVICNIIYKGDSAVSEAIHGESLCEQRFSLFVIYFLLTTVLMTQSLFTLKIPSKFSKVAKNAFGSMKYPAVFLLFSPFSQLI